MRRIKFLATIAKSTAITRSSRYNGYAEQIARPHNWKPSCLLRMRWLPTRLWILLLQRSMSLKI